MKNMTFIKSESVLLSKIEDEFLILSSKGFLIAYKNCNVDIIIKQLKNFDAEDWHEKVQENYFCELDGLDQNLMHDAAHLIAEINHELSSIVNFELLNLACGNLYLYNRVFSSNAFKLKARLQAIKVIPLLLYEFGWISPIIDRVLRRIDTGESVWSSYLSFFPGKVVTLKRISASKEITPFWNGLLPELMEILEYIPPEKIPYSAFEWQAFDSLCFGLNLLFENEQHKRNVKKKWLAKLAMIGWNKSYTKFMTFNAGLSALGDTFDFLDELAKASNWMQEYLNISQNSNITQNNLILWNRAPDNLGISRLVKASIRWHQLLNQQQSNTFSNLKSNVSWSALFSKPIILNPDVHALCICRQEDLISESMTMLHCVSTYVIKCFLGQSHIISLRNKDNKCLSTIEIIQSTCTKNDWQIVQHKILNNKSPPQELSDLEDLLIKSIKRIVNLNALEEWRIFAMNNNPFKNTNEDFSLLNLRRLFAVLGYERVLGLYMDLSKAKELLQKVELTELNL